MANYKPIGTSFDRTFRNDLNENFQTIDAVAEEAKVKAVKAESDVSKAIIDSHNALTNSITAKAATEGIQSQLNGIIIDSGTSDAEVIQARGTAPVLNERLNIVDEQLAETSSQLRSLSLKPLFVELFATMGRYGTGTPSGIAKYVGGNYVCTINGNVGDSFVTVTSGTISDGGGVWPCVIQDGNLNAYMNKVTGINGSTFTLLEPLPVTITNGKIGNLHDAVQGQHYTELGYFAFAQYIYKTNPKHAERSKNIKQFLGNDISSFWKLTTSFSKYNNVTNIDNADTTIQLLGTPHLVLNLASASHSAELEFKATHRGYIEIFVSTKNPAALDFLKSGNVVKTVNLNAVLKRVVLDYDDGDDIKVRIYDSNASGTAINSLRIGNTTLFINETKRDKLIEPNEKLVYIGDSWGEYHNKATTRELKRLMQAEGGNPTVLDFSKGGHTSTYALEWFEEYVLSNKPDTVIIEYFTNDFNSIGGTNVGTFLTPESTQKNMNISSLDQYVSNIKKMIDMAIENGIQPIVIMPTTTDSMSRSQSVANFTDDLWLGISQEKSKLIANEIETSIIKQAGSSSFGNRLKYIATEDDAALREGHVFYSDKNLTGGALAVFKNNGVAKASVKHDGTLDVQDVQPRPFYGTQAATNANRGVVYLFDGQGGSTKIDDELRIVIQKADGTFVTKKIQLID